MVGHGAAGDLLTVIQLSLMRMLVTPGMEKRVAASGSDLAWSAAK